MYERFYNLRERPFALSPDPEYLYLSRVHGEALDSIRYGIESRAGFIVVTGEIGAGKTTLLQTLLQRLDDRMLVARIVNTMLDPRELIEAIALDFGLPDTAKSKPALLRDLGIFLVQQREQGRRPLLVIDEAQNLSPQALEEVRLLSNLETEKSKLLQILLAGQPNLRDTIASPELEQFRQRIAVSYHLLPLDPAETVAYINYRLEHAALGEPPRFLPDATDLIYQVTGGVPRLINVVCDATLVFGYAEERRTLDGALLEEVIRELEATGIIPPAEVRQAARELADAQMRTQIGPAAPFATPAAEHRDPRAGSVVNAPALAERTVPPAPADRSFEPAAEARLAPLPSVERPIASAAPASPEPVPASERPIARAAAPAPAPPRAAAVAPAPAQVGTAPQNASTAPPATLSGRSAVPSAASAVPSGTAATPSGTSAVPPAPPSVPSRTIAAPSGTSANVPAGRVPPPAAPVPPPAPRVDPVAAAASVPPPAPRTPPAPVPPPVRPTTVFAAAHRAAAPSSPSGRPLASAHDPLPGARELIAARELAAQRELVQRRQAELAAKEEALLRRERQIAEQRRIMGEEYRLLRTAQPGRPLNPARPVARGAAGARGAAVAQPATTHATPRPRAWGVVPMWQRILRIFTGAHALRS
jgi:putative secretion ATPase (PEP-CTERM system associated)